MKESLEKSEQEKEESLQKLQEDLKEKETSIESLKNQLVKNTQEKDTALS